MEQRELAGYLMQFAHPIQSVDEPEGRRALEKARFVWGISHNSEGASLFYGLSLVEEAGKGRIAESDPLTFGPPDAAAFIINYGTDEVDLLAAACDDMKGSNCYIAWCKRGGR